MNPIDIFIMSIAECDARTRFYATQPIFGRLNSSSVGLLTREIRSRRPNAEGGIDAYNQMIAEQLAAMESREALEGMALEPRAEPMEVLQIIVSIKETLRDAVQLPDVLLNQMDDIKSTIGYLSAPVTYAPERVDALAKNLGEDPKLIAEIARLDGQRRAEELKRDAAQMLQIFGEIEPTLGFDFEDLPTDLQVRLYQSIEKSLDRQYANALSNALRSPDKMGNLTFFKEGKKRLKLWADHAMQTNPDLAMALVA